MRWARIFAVVLVIVALLFSVSESFDTWDNTAQTGDDVESNLVVLAISLAAVFACVRLFLVARRCLARLTVEHSHTAFVTCRVPLPLLPSGLMNSALRI